MSAKRKTLSLLLGLMACVAALVMTNLQSEKESVLDAAPHNTVKNLILEEGPQYLFNLIFKITP